MPFRENPKNQITMLYERFPGKNRVAFTKQAPNKGKAAVKVTVVLDEIANVPSRRSSLADSMSEVQLVKNGDEEEEEEGKKRKLEAVKVSFVGVGNNFKRAKLSAATCAVRELKKRGVEF